MAEPPRERWLPIPGWEGLYEVSDHGRVRSLDRFVDRKDGGRRPVPGQLMPARPNIHGYPSVRLSSGNHRYYRAVHRLVALAFLGPRPEGLQVRHLDGDKTNNAVSNLIYGTPSENQIDRVLHGRNHNALKTHCPQGHEYTPENTVRGARPTDRSCRTCRNDRARKRYAAKKVA